jgi:hypothetical protein
MNTTMRSAIPARLARPRHLRGVARSVVLTLGLLGAVVGLAGPAAAAETSSHGTGAGGGKVSMQRKVNEYEGQHRLSIAGDPSQWGLATGKDPELPVTPTLTRKVNEYEGQHR